MNVVAIIMAVFSLLGALDRIWGNRLGLGKEFEKGFMLLGTMALSMIGMIIISPGIAQILAPCFDFVYNTFGIGGYLAGLFCVLGHIFPIFFKFKGGKGVATVAAMVLTLDPVCFLILILLFILIVATTRFVSLGSVVCCMLYPILTYKLAVAGLSGWGAGFPVLISFAVAAVVIFMHRSNIKRLINHTENRISFSKKSKENKK